MHQKQGRNPESRNISLLRVILSCSGLLRTRAVHFSETAMTTARESKRIIFSKIIFHLVQ